MTCIVGIEDQRNQVVYIGGDLQGTGLNKTVNHTQSKVFSRNGVLFGFTGSYRFGQILEHDLDTPFEPRNRDQVYKWLVTTLVPSIKEALYRGGCDDKNNCLIGVCGELWELQDDFSVLRSVNGYYAIGSGEEYAKGSIQTDLKHQGVNVDYDSVVRNAIEVAGSNCPSVGTKAHVIHG